MSRLPIGPALAAAAAAGTARLSYAALRRRPPGGNGTWSRTNHRGEAVTLLGGPAVAAGALAGVLAAPGLSGRQRAALAVAGAGAAALGSYDDLAGSGRRRGFRGHLGALAHGEVTTGAVKLAGIGAAGLAASVLAGPGRAARPGGVARAGGAAGWRGADVMINAGLVAGGANLVNLFDLRPGRALKVALAAGTLLAATRRGRAAVAGPVAAGVALLPDDLAERAMLGDGGANALGALLGAAAGMSLPRPARISVLAAVAGLTAASEAVSFTGVIARTRPLNWLDMLGRRPAGAGAGLGPGPASEAAGNGSAAADRAAANGAAAGNGAAGSGTAADETGVAGADTAEAAAVTGDGAAPADAPQ